MQQTTITFPAIKLSPRHGHKLRGYFGTLFQERSPLLHNHLQNGQGFRYAYPLVQYKVVDTLPMLVGFNEGAQLLLELFREMKEIELEGQCYTLDHKHIQCHEINAGYRTDLLEYEFKTLWLALNQENYKTWLQNDEIQRAAQLQKLLLNQLITALRGIDSGPTPEEKLMLHLRTFERRTKFKNQTMTAFGGSFLVNALLPPFLGVGKSVSRGFGTISPVGTNHRT